MANERAPRSIRGSGHRLECVGNEHDADPGLERLETRDGVGIGECDCDRRAGLAWSDPTWSIRGGFFFLSPGTVDETAQFA